jgi:hypothetical protein
MTTKLELLYKQRNEIQEQIQKILNKEKEKAAAIIREKYTGKCFVHIDDPIREKKIFKVISINKNGTAHCIVVQDFSGDDKDGHFEFIEIRNEDVYEIDKPQYDYDLMFEAKEITPIEFDKTLVDVMDKIVSMSR